MSIKANHILFCINALTLLLILIIAFLPDNFLRIILGLPLVLFFPGYTLLAALFPRKGSLDGIERIALSFGMSIAVVPLIGLALNYTTWGIRLYPILLSLAIFIFCISIVAWYRQHKLPESGIPAVSFTIKPFSWVGRTRTDKILSVLLAIVILGALGTLVYVITMPKTGEKFTEFYILGLDGQAANYPMDLEPDTTGKVIMGIINQEQDTVSYWVEIKIEGVTDNTIGPIVLASGNKWESMVSFTPRNIGENQKVEFLLYKGERSQLYGTLHLWMDVKEAP